MLKAPSEESPVLLYGGVPSPKYSVGNTPPEFGPYLILNHTVSGEWPSEGSAAEIVPLDAIGNTAQLKSSRQPPMSLGSEPVHDELLAQTGGAAFAVLIQ